MDPQLHVPAVADIVQAADPSEATSSEQSPPAERTYKFNVTMSCGGCSNAVSRALKKVEKGISSFDVDLAKQEVTVTGTISDSVLHDTIAKTGKVVSKGELVL